MASPFIPMLISFALLLVSFAVWNDPRRGRTGTLVSVGALAFSLIIAGGLALASYANLQAMIGS